MQGEDTNLDLIRKKIDRIITNIETAFKYYITQGLRINFLKMS